MKPLKLFVMSFLFVFGLQASASDQQLAKKFEASDKVVAQKLALKDMELVKTRGEQKRWAADIGLDQALSSGSTRGRCDDEESPGTSSCWDKCSKEGWSSSYCSNLCGNDNETGQLSCWDKCSKEGWSSSYCSNQCGTSTDGGQQGCWDKCSKEGWSSSYCKTQCGTN